MGYTHYWQNSREFTDTEWQRFTAIARRIFNLSRAHGVKISGPCGTGSPDVTRDCVAFNGREPDDYETAAINRHRTEFDFCKTARRPYDATVVAVLMAAVSANSGFSWSSDGSGETGDFDAGDQLFRRAVALESRSNRNAA